MLYDGLENYYGDFFRNALIVDAADLRSRYEHKADIGRLYRQVLDLCARRRPDQVVIDIALETLPVDDVLVNEFFNLVHQDIDTVIVTGESHIKHSRLVKHRWHSNPRQYRWFLPFFYIYHQKYRHTSLPELAPRSSGIMCFNNNTNVFRMVVYLLLRKHDLHRKICYSQHQIDFNKHWWIYLDQNLQQDLEQLSDVTPVILDHDTMHRHEWLNSPLYHTCAVNFVIEVCVANPSRNFAVCLSEKCVKPLIAGQIPVVFGAPGITAYLEALGFDMFSDVIPWHSWDSTADLSTRATALVDWLSQWHQQENFSSLYQHLKTRVRENQRYLLSSQFATLLTQDLPRLCQDDTSTQQIYSTQQK